MAEKDVASANFSMERGREGEGCVADRRNSFAGPMGEGVGGRGLGEGFSCRHDDADDEEDDKDDGDDEGDAEDVVTETDESAAGLTMAPAALLSPAMRQKHDHALPLH